MNDRKKSSKSDWTNQVKQMAAPNNLELIEKDRLKVQPIILT